MSTILFAKLQNHPTLNKHPYVRRHQILLKMLYSLERKKRIRSEKEKELLILKAVYIGMIYL